MQNKLLSQQMLPWYKQFWPCFIIFLPLSAVLACMVTIMLALQSPNALVVDDYKKIGLTTQRSWERDQQAVNLNISAVLKINRNRGQIEITLNHTNIDSEKLLLHLQHPTHQARDQIITLSKRSNNVYINRNSGKLNGRWYLELTPMDKYWRLSGELAIGLNSITLNHSKHQDGN